MWLDEGIDSGNIIFSKKTLENSKRLNFRRVNTSYKSSPKYVFRYIKKIEFDEKT